MWIQDFTSLIPSLLHSQLSFLPCSTVSGVREGRHQRIIHDAVKPCTFFALLPLTTTCITSFLPPRSLPTGKSATTQLASQFYRPPLVPPSQLAAPCFNSTAQLYSKIQDLKQQRKTSSGQGAKAQHTQPQLSVSREDSKSLNDLEGLQEMVGQKLLKVSVWPVLEGDLILFLNG